VKTCSGPCGKTLELTCFGKRSDSPDGLQYMCKICIRERNNTYRRNNPDIISKSEKAYHDRNREYRAVNSKVRSRRWREANREKNAEKNANYRARKINAEKETLPRDWWAITVNHYGRKCVKCSSTDRVAVDHIIPLSKGGLHHFSNFQVLCISCNSSKGNRSTEDFRDLAAGILVGYANGQKIIEYERR
jgi:5-methylcytosine-specific restriction endonuclease McrA